jgi:hypothetical protein
MLIFGAKFRAAPAPATDKLGQKRIRTKDIGGFVLGRQDATVVSGGFVSGGQNARQPIDLAL